jgi:hypothetical protein
MALKDITITGSIGSYPTLSYGQKTYVSSTDEQSFPIEHITGSAGGTTPNFNGQYSTTDLFVNVTQLWSGSINTQAGIVDFTHDTQEEFINGEYSGSSIEVTHQRLIDADCIQFLNVSTVPTNYKSFFYVAVNSTPFSPPDPSYVTIIDNFLNTNTSPNSGETYILSTSYKIQTPGGGGISTIKKVTHIKVNKFDDSGNDNTLSLQELNSLRILFSDLGVVNFPILSITEYPTYYLYSTDKILPNGSLNSVDNNVLDYRFSASAFSTPYNIPINAFFIPLTIPYNVHSISTANSFTSSVGIYEVDNTNNIPITFTSSFTLNNPGPNDIYITCLATDIVNPTTFPSPIQWITASANSISNYSVTSSQVYLRENTRYILSLYYNSNGNTNLTAISNLQWKFTQSIAPSSLTNTAVLSPYITENFEYSDCNVLINNATNLEYDPNFYKVNYDTGLLIPSNQQEILDGTAEFAPVKPYNYSANAQILPRYIGTRYSSDGINNPSITNVESILTYDNINYGTFTNKNIAPVQSLSTYFAYFEWIGGTNHELQNKVAAGIKYLINEDGDILSPNISSSYYYNLIDNFETDKKANIVLYSDANGISNIGASKTILRAGAIPWGIAASQTGSAFNIQPTMCFTSSNQLAGDFASIIQFTDAVVNPGIPLVLDLTAVLDGNNLAVTLIPNPSSNFIFIQPQPTTLLNLKLLSKISVQNSSKSVGAYIPPINVTIQFQAKTTSVQLNYEPFYTFTVTTKNNFEEIPFELITPPFPARYAEIICVVSYSSTDPNNVVVISNASSQIPNILCVGQTPLPNNPFAGVSPRGTATYAFAPLLTPNSYWITGSLSRNVLTSSQSTFSHVYNSPRGIQQNYSASGYFDFLEFHPSYGDTIRFGGSELQNYIITEVIQSGSRLCLKLDRDVSQGANIDSFLIKRFQPHPSFITLDWDGFGYNGGSGFLIPEYTNDNTIKNFDNVIVKLKERGLI